MEVPWDFKCPISLEIMTDPVIISSGHTFDRSSIEKWIESGHLTCPITKIPLPNPPSLIPNHALRSLISIHTATSSPLPNRTAATSVEQASCTVSAILGCVDSGEGKVREKALRVLLKMSLEDDNKVGLVAEGVIGHLVPLLRSPNKDGSRATAATILTSLAVVEVNKATIGAYPYAIIGLISLLGSGNGRERKEAATALYTLCSYPENRRKCVEFGGVQVLITAASTGLERAVEVLGLLAKCKEGRLEMAKVENFVSILVYFLKNGSSRGVQCALYTMASLCMYSEGLRGKVLGEGVFEYCVGLLEDESDKVQRNASNLLQILRGKRLTS